MNYNWQINKNSQQYIRIRNKDVNIVTDMIASILSILLNIENTSYLIDIYYKKWRYIKYPIYIHRNIRRKWKWLGNLCNLNNNQNKLEDLFKFQSKCPEKKHYRLR